MNYVFEATVRYLFRRVTRRARPGEERWPTDEEYPLADYGMSPTCCGRDARTSTHAPHHPLVHRGHRELAVLGQPAN